MVSTGSYEIDCMFVLDIKCRGIKERDKIEGLGVRLFPFPVFSLSSRATPLFVCGWVVVLKTVLLGPIYI